jgi:flagellar hook-length control protein FliK
MADFAFDLSALVLPSAAPAALPPPPSARSSVRFEDHLGQASRTSRDPAESPPSFTDRSAESAVSAGRSSAESEQAAASHRRRDDDRQERENDVDAAAADGSVKENGTGDVASDPSAEAAAAASGQAGGKSQSKTASKRRASDLDAAGVEAIEGKTVAAIEEVRGKPGNKSRISGKGPAAELSTTNESVQAKDADDGLGEEKTPEVKALPGEQKLLANATIGLSDHAEAPAGAGQVPVDALPKGVAEDTAVKAKANADAGIAAQSDATAAREASPKRVRGKNDELAARSSVEPSRSQEAAAGHAPVAAAVEAIADISGKDGESADKERSSEDVQPRDRNDKSETRVGAAPALIAARTGKGTEANGRGEGLTEAERARFVQRVASAFRSFGDEGGEVRLRLSPPELGSLRVELTVRDGILSARLEAETSAARNLLLDNLPALRERLAEQNIKVEKFDVDVRDERRQSSGEQFTGQPDQGRQGDRQRGRTFDNRPVTAAAVARATRGPIKHGDASELNIVI